MLGGGYEVCRKAANKERKRKRKQREIYKIKFVDARFEGG